MTISQRRPGASPVFVSYARRDNVGGWITRVHDALEAALIARGEAADPVFFDTRDIHLFQEWQHKLAWALRQAKVMLAFTSRAYFDSLPCQWELDEHSGGAHHPAVPEGLIAVVLEDTDEATLFAPQGWQTGKLGSAPSIDMSKVFTTAQTSQLPEAALPIVEALADLVAARLAAIRDWENLSTNITAGAGRFFGRADELDQLRQATQSSPVTVVQGLGGVGKTELVEHFALTSAALFPAGSLILPAAGATQFLSLLTNLEAFPSSDGVVPGDGAAIHRQLLHRTQSARLLLILDEVNRPELLTDPDLLQLLGQRNIAVIVTTRLPLGGEGPRFTLRGLHPKDAIVFLADVATGVLDEDAAARLSELVAGHPLALEHAAIYLSDHPDVTVRQYLEYLTANGPLASDCMLPAHQLGFIAHPGRRLTTTLSTTVEALSTGARAALELAATRSCNWAELEHRSADPSSHDDWPSIRHELECLDLVRFDHAGEAVHVHPLIFDYLRSPNTPGVTNA